MILKDGLKHKKVQIIKAFYFENTNKSVLEGRYNFGGQKRLQGQKRRGPIKEACSDKAVSELPKELAVGYSLIFLSLKTYVAQLWVNPWPASSESLNRAGKATEIQNKSW